MKATTLFNSSLRDSIYTLFCFKQLQRTALSFFMGTMATKAGFISFFLFISFIAGTAAATPPCGVIGRALGLTLCVNLCVDLKVDLLNCGGCGIRCAFGKVCCLGKCTNLRSDWKNCGLCGRSCKKEGSCKFGLCDYA